MIVYGWDGFEPHRRSHCLNNDCPPSIDWPRLFTATWQKWPKKNLFFAASGSQCVSLSKIFKWGLIFHAALILVWAQYCPDSSVCVCAWVYVCTLCAFVCLCRLCFRASIVLVEQKVFLSLTHSGRSSAYLYIFLKSVSWFCLEKEKKTKRRRAQMHFLVKPLWHRCVCVCR